MFNRVKWHLVLIVFPYSKGAHGARTSAMELVALYSDQNCPWFDLWHVHFYPMHSKRMEKLLH